MADWSKAVESFQRGSDWNQRRRANSQFEKARDLTLEGAEYDMQARRSARTAVNPDAASVLGDDYAAGNTAWTGQLEDPFAYKLFDWFKSKMKGKGGGAAAGGGKKKKALDLGGEGGFNTSNPVGTGLEDEGTPAQTYAIDAPAEIEEQPLADGGLISKSMEDARGASQSFASQAGVAPVTTVNAGGAQPIASPTGVLQTGYADGGSVEAEEWRRTRDERARTDRETVDRSQSAPKRKALDAADDKVGKFTSRAEKGASLAKRAGAGAKRAGALGALASTALDTATTDTDDYRERFGLQLDEGEEPSLAGEIGVRALGAASDLGNALTLGQAGRFYRDKQRKAGQGAAPAPTSAIPEPEQMPAVQMGAARPGRQAAAPAAAEPELVDFSGMDIDAKDVPDMKTDDWSKYRAQMIAAAQKSGRPEDVAKVNGMVTEMQQKGFLNYAQQGLALQQAGNARAAQAAYRAAFQYFPNGNDVEFGIKGRQIIGFGRDEKTGKVVPGSELIMEPERVAVLIENFKNPEAFRMWTKDWREFEHRERQYEEVTKPLAQAQSDALATNSDAAVIRAQNMGGAGGTRGAGMRNAEKVFRERLEMEALNDPATSDYLASIMSQVKAANPSVPDNTIMQVIMTAHEDGSLQERLARMGIQ